MWFVFSLYKWHHCLSFSTLKSLCFFIVLLQWKDLAKVLIIYFFFLFSMHNFSWWFQLRLLYDIFYLVNCQLLFIQLKKKQKKCAAISLFYCFFYFLILQISLPASGGDGWWIECEGEDLLCESETTHYCPCILRLSMHMLKLVI